MLPIGPLMIEHRLIERMIALIDKKGAEARSRGAIDASFVDAAVEFIRTYADRTHHGKEEDILFRDLAGKKMSEDDARVMEELVAEHRSGRRIVGELVSANEAYRAGDESALKTVLEKLRKLVDFYPNHIQKEDKIFFPASMRYLDEAERESMLAEMWTFDRQLIHEKYRGLVESFESEEGTVT